MEELGLRATASEIEDMISEIDLDQTGTVDLEGKPNTPSRAANANIPRNRVHQDDDGRDEACEYRAGDAQRFRCF